MIKQSDLKVGLQVMYVPSHIRERHNFNPDSYLSSPETEIGFVSSWRGGDVVFCRFFWKRTLDLRTVANSEGCSLDDLFAVNYYPQEHVDATIGMMREEPEEYGWHEQKVARDD